MFGGFFKLYFCNAWIVLKIQEPRKNDILMRSHAEDMDVSAFIHAKGEERERVPKVLEWSEETRQGERVCVFARRVWGVYFHRLVQTVPAALCKHDRVLWLQPEEKAAQSGPHGGSHRHFPPHSFFCSPGLTPTPFRLGWIPCCTTSTVLGASHSET